MTLLLQDTILRTFSNKEAKKKMSPTNARAFNTMRQRLKKHNVAFQEQIDKYRENPESTEEEVSADSDSDDSASAATSDAGSEAGKAPACACPCVPTLPRLPAELMSGWPAATCHPSPI